MASPRDKDAGIRLDEWSPRLLKSRLYQRILVDIIIGALAPGEQLDENLLARRYGGGLAGIREALARLALEGLVVRRARVGTSVAPLDLMGAREAFEARRLVEVHCAGLAAEHASEAEIAAIRAYCETDVANTYLLFLRFQLIRGALDAAAYESELALLRKWISEQPGAHWKDFAAAWP